MPKYRYLVFGWRWSHRNTPTNWHVAAGLPLWLAEYRKRDPKAARRWWTVERLYHREEN